MGVTAAHFGQTSTGPECGAKKPHPTKRFFRLCISRCLYIRNHDRIQKFACLHKAFQHALPSHLYVQGTRGHQPGKGLPLPRLCSSTVAEGRCLSPCHGASPTVSHQASWSGPMSLQGFASLVIRQQCPTTAHLCGCCILNPA